MGHPPLAPASGPTASPPSPNPYLTEFEAGAYWVRCKLCDVPDGDLVEFVHLARERQYRPAAILDYLRRKGHPIHASTLRAHLEGGHPRRGRHG